MEEEILIKKKKKNNGKRWIIIVILLAIILLAGGGYYYYTNYYNKDKPTEETVKVSLKDDFYESINYETLKKAKIPRDTGNWSHVYDASKTIEKRQKEIVDEILSDPNYKNERLDQIIELYTDYETRNKNGYSELKPYLEMIDKTNTIEEFNKISFTLQRDFGFNPLITAISYPDINDAKKNVFVFDTVTLETGDIEYYENPKYSRVKDIFIDIRKRMLKELGYNEEEINTISSQIDEFNKYLYSKTTVTTDTHGTSEKAMELLNRKYTLQQITNEIKNLPIKEYLQKLKLADLDNYVVIDMDQLKAFDEYYTVEHLHLLKNLAKIKLMALNYNITEDGEKYSLEIQNKLNGTFITLEEKREDEILGIKSAGISDELQKRYEEKYFTSEDKKKVLDLVEDIKKYYKEIIQKTDWLSSSSKKEAIKKLDQMKVNIGYDENNKNDEQLTKITPKSAGGTFMSYTIDSARNDYDHYAEEFKKENAKLTLDTLEINAFYNPNENSINFLAGFKLLYENEADYYRLMGYFGFVIGHEISHAFDNIGSKYDENGKLRDWWTTEDRDNYKKLTKKIEDYYSNFEYMGFKVDGERTLGENIADLASMKAMVSIAESKGATKDDFKKLFEAYADLWACKMNKETAESLSLSDEHAPDKVRVNAVLSSIDKFYEVYDIKENDKMYVAKENRVSLW